jgi:hypothetical protein
VPWRGGTAAASSAPFAKPPRRLSLRSASAFLNSTLTCDQASALESRVQHHAQGAVDAEPGMPEAGVAFVHVFGWVESNTRIFRVARADLTRARCYR